MKSVRTIKKITVPLAIALLVITAIAAPMTAFAADDVPGWGAPNTAGIKSIDELDGKALGVQTAVLYEELVKDRLPNASWQYYTMPNDMILALESNKISAYLIEEVGFYAQYANHPELVCLDEYAGVCPFSVVIGDNENQAKYLKQMNDFIDESNENGFLDELYDYWVMNFDANTSVIRNYPVTTGENGSVTIAIEGGYEPFSFDTENGFSGFDVEFMMNFCARYGYNWQFASVPFESIAPGAETGKYDFGMNIAFSEERDEGAQLTQPYYACNIVMVLEGEDNAKAGFFERQITNFKKTFIKENRWKDFVSGTGTTILITVCSAALGTILGFAAYYACYKGSRIAKTLTESVTWLIDGMPTVVLLMILFYVIFGKTRLTGTAVSIVGFTLIFACGMYDMLCVGFNAVGRGQVEAAKALGYSEGQAFFKVLLPQAALHFLPIYKNEMVDLIKETSIVGYIAVLDLTKISDLVRSRTYEAFFALIATAIVYFLIEGLMNAIISYFEKRVDPRHRTAEQILKGIDTAEE